MPATTLCILSFGHDVSAKWKQLTFLQKQTSETSNKNGAHPIILSYKKQNAKKKNV